MKARLNASRYEKTQSSNASLLFNASTPRALILLAVLFIFECKNP